MGLARYDIIERKPHWSVLHDNRVEGEFLTKEAAFEAAASAASLAIRQGHEVQIAVPGASATETRSTTGAPTHG